MSRHGCEIDVQFMNCVHTLKLIQIKSLILYFIVVKNSEIMHKNRYI